MTMRLTRIDNHTYGYGTYMYNSYALRCFMSFERKYIGKILCA